jgi:hypothetical protein
MLFAALEIATGRITADACYPRHRNEEFVAFLKLVTKAHPRVPLHVVCERALHMDQDRRPDLDQGAPSKTSDTRH